jgi:hypothetical protein
MKCASVQQLLDEAQRPEESQGLEVEAHVASCAECQLVRAELVELRAGLAGMAPPALPDGFELELRRRLVQEQTSAADESGQVAQRTSRRGPRPARGGRALRLVALAAALMVMTAAALLYWFAVQGPATERTHYRLDVAVRAQEAHPNAQFQLLLPRGVELPQSLADLSPDGRSLTWNSRLEPGNNAISLPLVLTGDAAEVRTRVTVAGWTGEVRAALSRSKVAGGLPGSSQCPITLALVVPATRQEAEP